MFDLSNMKFIKNDEEHGRRNYSFVGIQRSKVNDDVLEFWLPLGFSNFDHSNYDQVKSFFFKMYKTFKVYLKKKEAILSDEDITIDRDGIIEKEGGFSFENEKRDQPIFYGKLNAIDKILEGYDELRISALEKKQVRSQEVDFTKLHRYMHQAVYLEEDVIYLDEMNIAKNLIMKSSPPILQLFCFIFTEIKSELDEADVVPVRAFELSEQFKEEFLQPDSTLFKQDSFSETLELLREIHDGIDINTTYKDEDYWHFFEAVEAFLYGERSEDDQDIYWGFSSFYDIWEDMCQSYVLSKNEYKEQVVFADVAGKLKDFQNLKNNPFCVRVNNKNEKRYLKPDLVLLAEIDYQGESILDYIFTLNEQIVNGFRNFGVFFMNYNHINQKYPELIEIYFRYLNRNPFFNQNTNQHKYIREQEFPDFKREMLRQIYEYSSFKFIANGDYWVKTRYRIIDYKYMRISDYQNYSPNHLDEEGKNKVKEDIHKQLVYEWTVQQNWSAKTQSEFWIPFYSTDYTLFEEEETITNIHFNESQIKLVKINFNVLQNHYLEQEI